MGDAAIVSRLHHVGDAREFVRSTRGQAADRAGPPRDLDRALRLGAASHVHRHHSVLRGRAAAVGLVVGRGDVAAVRCAVRRSRSDRGTRAARRPARLWGLRGAGAVSTGARALVKPNCRTIHGTDAERCPTLILTPAAAIAGWCGSNAPPILRRLPPATPSFSPTK